MNTFFAPLRAQQWRCHEHLPAQFKTWLKGDSQGTVYMILNDNNVRTLTPEYIKQSKDIGFQLSRDEKHVCAVCQYLRGLQKVQKLFEKHRGKRVANAFWNNWMTPRPDGSCGYAEWSWKKMHEECGLEI